MFSPIRKVTFDVEKTRVGGEIDYDKLDLSYLLPMDRKILLNAVHYAVSVLRTQLEHFLAKPEIPFNDISQVPQEAEEEKTVGLIRLALKVFLLSCCLNQLKNLNFQFVRIIVLVNAGVKANC